MVLGDSVPGRFWFVGSFSYCLSYWFYMTNTPVHFGCWNLRGLNDPLKQSEARKWVKNNNLSLVGLIEHKSKEPKAQNIVNIMFPHWHAANNFALGPLGRIPLCWDPLILAIQVLTQSSQFIH